MKIAILANPMLKEELLMQGAQDVTELFWVNEISDLINHSHADAYIDLLFETEEQRVQDLKKIQGTVIINSVIKSGIDVPADFIRINGWPTFLKRSMTEASCQNQNQRSGAEAVFSCFNKQIEWVADIPGFISPRVVAAIINEAYFTLEENVSTKNEIDVAMKLGTNYPYGPFEWGEKIGLKNIYDLLVELAKKNLRYEPAGLLKKEALQ